MTANVAGPLREAARWKKAEFAFWLLPVAAYFVFPSDLALLSQIAITALFALSLDLILGYAGIVSLGHAAFFGTGAYAAGLLARAGYGDPLLGRAAVHPERVLVATDQAHRLVGRDPAETGAARREQDQPRVGRQLAGVWEIEPAVVV